MKNKLEQIYIELVEATTKQGQKLSLRPGMTPPPVATPAAAPVDASPNADQLANKASSLVSDLNRAARKPKEFNDLMQSGGDFDVATTSEGHPQYNYKTIQMFIDVSYRTKNPLLIYGESGLGKSAVVLNKAKQIAQSKGKRFVEWNSLDLHKQKHVINNPLKYFVFIDVRTARLEPTDFMGIPDITDTEAWFKSKIYPWMYFMTRPNADGILFLDEINQGRREVLTNLFDTINVKDRRISSIRYADDIAVMAAGNLGVEHGNEPLPIALTGRFTAGVLIADPEGWFEWASANNIDSRIIAFVKTNPEKNFYVKPKADGSTFANPRSMEMLSNDIKELEKMYNEYSANGIRPKMNFNAAVITSAVATCGEEWGRSFGVFLQHIKSFDLQHVIDTAEELPREAADKLWALVVYISSLLSPLAARLHKNEQLTERDLKALQATAKIFIHVVPEFKNILWSYITDKIHIPEELASLLNHLAMNTPQEYREDFRRIMKELGSSLKAAKDALRNPPPA